MKCVGRRHDGRSCGQSVGVSRRTRLCRHHNSREGAMVADGISILTKEDIFMADDGILIMNKPIQTDKGPVSIIPIAQEGDEAPQGAFKWADDRPLCRYVQNSLHDGAEPPGNRCTAYKDGMCRAASLGGSLPCLFHEAPNSEGWRQARRYERIPCSTDANPEGWALAERKYVYHPVWDGRKLAPMFASRPEEAIKEAVAKVREQFGIPKHIPLAAIVQIPSNMVRVFVANKSSTNHEHGESKGGLTRGFVEGSAA